MTKKKKKVKNERREVENGGCRTAGREGGKRGNKEGHKTRAPKSGKV